MRVFMAHFNIKQGSMEDFQTARDRIVDGLCHDRPQGVRYTWGAIPDSAEFVGWLELDQGVVNPLPNMDAAKEFMSHIQSWVSAPPTRHESRFVGSYSSAH